MNERGVGEAFEVEVRDGTMGGRRHGPAGAPALVFLHANGFCGSTYAGLLAPLGEEGVAVAALDLRGHGRTRLPADPDRQTGWTVHRDDLIAALERLAPAGAVVAGHSMGATSGLLAAAARPDLVKGLVLFDPVIAPAAFHLYAAMPWTFALWRRGFPLAKAAARRRDRFESRAQALAAYAGRGAFKSWTGSFLADYLEDGLTPAPEGGFALSCAPAFEAACFAGQRHDPHAALRLARAPIRLLRAERRSTTTPAAAAAIRRRGGVVETVEGASHFLPMERPDLAIAALRAGLAA